LFQSHKSHVSPHSTSSFLGLGEARDADAFTPPRTQHAICSGSTLLTSIRRIPVCRLWGRWPPTASSRLSLVQNYGFWFFVGLFLQNSDQVVIVMAEKQSQSLSLGEDCNQQHDVAPKASGMLYCLKKRMKHRLSSVQ